MKIDYITALVLTKNNISVREQDVVYPTYDPRYANLPPDVPPPAVPMAQQTVPSTAASIVSSLHNHPNAVALGAMTGLIYGAHKLIQNYMTKAARDCKDVPNKAGCIQQHKQQGSESAIEYLRAQIPQCRGDMKCMQKIRRAIERMGGEG